VDHNGNIVKEGDEGFVADLALVKDGEKEKSKNGPKKSDSTDSGVDATTPTDSLIDYDEFSAKKQIKNDLIKKWVDINSEKSKHLDEVKLNRSEIEGTLNCCANKQSFSTKYLLSPLGFGDESIERVKKALLEEQGRENETPYSTKEQIEKLPNSELKTTLLTELNKKNKANNDLVENFYGGYQKTKNKDIDNFLMDQKDYKSLTDNDKARVKLGLEKMMLEGIKYTDVGHFNSAQRKYFNDNGFYDEYTKGVDDSKREAIAKAFAAKSERDQQSNIDKEKQEKKNKEALEAEMQSEKLRLQQELDSANQKLNQEYKLVMENINPIFKSKKNEQSEYAKLEEQVLTCKENCSFFRPEQNLINQLSTALQNGSYQGHSIIVGDNQTSISGKINAFSSFTYPTPSQVETAIGKFYQPMVEHDVRFLRVEKFETQLKSLKKDRDDAVTQWNTATAEEKKQIIEKLTKINTAFDKLKEDIGSLDQNDSYATSHITQEANLWKSPEKFLTHVFKHPDAYAATDADQLVFEKLYRKAGDVSTDI
jgi:hypothetical protein